MAIPIGIGGRLKLSFSALDDRSSSRQLNWPASENHYQVYMTPTA